MQAYLSLIQQLLTCRSGEEAQILNPAMEWGVVQLRGSSLSINLY